MNIKIKSSSETGIMRLEVNSILREVLVNEDIIHPEKENIALCFADRKHSGIVEISPAEFEKIYDTIKSRIHLIKSFRKLSGGGVIKL